MSVAGSDSSSSGAFIWRSFHAWRVANPVRRKADELAHYERITRAES